MKVKNSIDEVKRSGVDVQKRLMCWSLCQSNIIESREEKATATIGRCNEQQIGV